MTQGTAECSWNATSWPYETSRALTGLSNLLVNYPTPHQEQAGMDPSSSTDLLRSGHMPGATPRAKLSMAVSLGLERTSNRTKGIGWPTTSCMLEAKTPLLSTVLNVLEIQGRGTVDCTQRYPLVGLLPRHRRELV